MKKPLPLPKAEVQQIVTGHTTHDGRPVIWVPDERISKLATPNEGLNIKRADECLVEAIRRAVELLGLSSPNALRESLFVQPSVPLNSDSGIEQFQEPGTTVSQPVLTVSRFNFRDNLDHAKLSSVRGLFHNDDSRIWIGRNTPNLMGLIHETARMYDGVEIPASYIFMPQAKDALLWFRKYYSRLLEADLGRCAETLLRKGGKVTATYTLPAQKYEEAVADQGRLLLHSLGQNV